MAYYVDTSALVKLVVAERETETLRSWLLATDGELVASDLVRTELIRTVRRVVPERMRLASQVMDALTLLALTPGMLATAGRIEPVELRSLDAIHLAAALHLGDDLDGIVTYDERLAAAADANGVAVLAPS